MAPYIRRYTSVPQLDLQTPELTRIILPLRPPIIAPFFDFGQLEKRLAIAGASWTATQLFKVKCYAQDARDYFRDILLQSLNTYQDYRVDPTCYPSITQLYPDFTKELGDPFLDICLLPDPEDDPGTPTIELDPYGEGNGLRIGYSVFQLNSNPKRAEYEKPFSALESVEKVVCLILFSEHIIAFCDARWEEVDTSDFDYSELIAIEDELEEREREDAKANQSESVDAVYHLSLSMEMSEEALMSSLGLEPLFEDKLKISESVAGVAGAMLAGRKAGGVMEVEEILGLVGVAQMQEANVLQAVAI